MNFVTADWHYGHENIIKYCNRPFKDKYEMDNALIRQFNRQVTPEDHTYFVGDFTLESVRKAREVMALLNGRKTFLLGNHDSSGFTHTMSLTIYFGGLNIAMTHFPELRILSTPHNPINFNLTGHVHEAWKYKWMDDMLCINVGVDVWDFKPVSLQEILKYYSRISPKEKPHGASQIGDGVKT